MFTATRLQVATYLLGICPFSIAFLVFLNSSVSFVVTDLLSIKDGVGDAVGTLGFADELVALVACPLWGLLSDRVGVRTVCVIGYMIIALALVVFVQARNVYPQLLLARLFFSIGGAAASTMVTAVLPTMTGWSKDPESNKPIKPSLSRISSGVGHTQSPSLTSELTITPARFQTSAGRSTTDAISEVTQSDSHVNLSRISGFVGMFTGCGALLALAFFLPLPVKFQDKGVAPGKALQLSYYIVAGVSAFLAIWCFVGLRRLTSEQGKGWKLWAGKSTEDNRDTALTSSSPEPWKLLYRAFLLGFQRRDIGLGYLGGFVARASSVAISLFIPLLVNSLYLKSGLCPIDGNTDKPGGLPDIKRRCKDAYILAATLTGVSQLVALLCAPAFGYFSARSADKSIPLMMASVAGIIGYPLLISKISPYSDETGRRTISFVAVSLVGISQIGAIVCSLSSLSIGLLTTKEPLPSDSAANEERSRLLDIQVPKREPKQSAVYLKGSAAGIYSFYGGAAILLLTKLGGSLFDNVSTGAPFYMMTAFNGILFLGCAISWGFKANAET